MTEKEKTTTATEKTEETKNPLENGEIMRLSVRKIDDETFSTSFASDGLVLPMVRAITKVLEEEFDMIALPKKMFGGIGIIEIGLAEIESEDSGEGNTDAKGEE